jgi:hypothetical protein
MAPTYPYASVNGVIQLPWESMYTFMVVMGAGKITLATGTCFCVSRNEKWFIVTNRHNVTGLNQHTNVCLDPNGRVPLQLTVILPTGNLGNEWWSHVIRVRDDDWSPLWIEHPVYGRKIDVVAFPIIRPPEARFFGASLDDANDFPLEVGDAAHAVGYRRGEPEFSLFPQWIPCTLETSLQSRWNELPAFLVRGNFFRGSSGSPVLAYREDAQNLRRSDGSVIASNWASRLLGLYSGRVIGNENLGVVWKVECIREIIDHTLQRSQT